MSIIDSVRAVFRSDSRPQLAGPRQRVDSWQNLYTSLGIQGKDQRVSTRHAGRSRISDDELASLYETNWIAGRFINSAVNATTRHWFTVQVSAAAGTEADAKLAEAKDKVSEYLRVLNAKANVKEAFCWARLFGGSVILVGADDGAADLALPLNESAIKTIKYLQVYDRRYALPDGAYEDDPSSPDFGMPRLYRLRHPSGGAERVVHRSRLLRFDGAAVDVQRQRELQSWGMSELERIYEPARDYGVTMGATAVAAGSFSQGVLAVDNLAQLLSSGDTTQILDRLHAFRLGLGMANVALIDSKYEKYERIGQQVTGLSDIIDRLQMDVAGATGIPTSVLFGTQAGKLAGAQEDTSRWESELKDLQEAKLDRPMRRLVQLIWLAKDGPTKGVEPESWKVEWAAIVPSDPDKEIDRKKKQADIDHLYYGDNVLQPSEIRKSRFAGAQYSHDTALDPEITKAQEEADRAEAENAKGGPPPTPGPGGAPSPAPSGGPTGRGGTERQPLGGPAPSGPGAGAGGRPA